MTASHPDRAHRPIAVIGILKKRLVMRGLSLCLACAFAAFPIAASEQGHPPNGRALQEAIIPAPFQGEWRVDLRGCPPIVSDVIDWVGAKRMRFDHSVGEVRQVIAHDDGSITVLADFLGEGDHWEGKVHMALSPSRSELTIDFGQGSTTRHRCPANVAQ